MKKTIYLDLLWTLVWLLGFVALSGLLERNLLEKQQSKTIQQLGLPTRALVLQAHRVKDDLMIEQTVRALAQAPGVRWAAVVDESEHLLAHSDPALLGQHLKVTTSAVHCILKEDERPWGQLIMSYADRSADRALWRHTIYLIAGALFFFCSAIARTLMWRKSVREQENRCEELILHAHQIQTKWEQEAERSKQQQVLASQWLAQAVEQIEKPVLLLDHTQRLLTFSPAAETYLNIQGLAMLLGKSWQAIPLLKDAGNDLQLSIKAPGKPIDSDNPSSRLQFLSLCSRDRIGVTSTWISFV